MKYILAPLSLVLALLMSEGELTHVYAQPGHYNGPPVDIERIRQEPPLYDECSRLSQKSGREVLACNFGVDEARRTAMKYGGGYGHLHGFLRGFSWGLHQMADTTANDAWAMDQGARAASQMDSYLSPALQLGRQQGEAQGNAAGSKLAAEKFASAVDTGKLPSPQFALPAASYAGEDNGYVRFVDPNGPKLPQQILRDQLGNMNFHHRAYDNLDHILLGEIPRLPLGDAWHDDGIHRFEMQQWLDANSALKVWLDRPIDTRSRFDTLNNPPLTEPVLDREGKPIQENGTPKVRAIDLQQVFKTAFVHAYKYYVRYYFSHELYRAMDEGQMQGELVGIELGKKMAYQRGMIEAFNAKVKESSLHAFQTAYESAGRSAFKTTFDDYANTARLNVDFIRIIGMKEDGIIQPGETIAVSFRVTNSGGRSTAVRASMAGDVINPQSLALDTMPALATKVFNTPAIAAISPQLRTGTNANLILKVNEKEIPYAEKVLTPIQIASQKSAVETTQGTAHVLVAVHNISTLRSMGDAKVDWILPNKTLSQVLSALDANQSKETEMSISGLDPIEIIQGIVTRVQVTMNDQFMSDSTLKLAPADIKLELAAYFNQLIQGKGLIPATVRPEDRILEVRKMIAERNLADVSSDMEGNLWKDSTLSTMVGLLVHNLKTSEQTASTRKVYAELGRDLWEHRKELGKVLFFKSGKRKEYESLCKQLMQRK